MVEGQPETAGKLGLNRILLDFALAYACRQQAADCPGAIGAGFGQQFHWFRHGQQPET